MRWTAIKITVYLPNWKDCCDKTAAISKLGVIMPRKSRNIKRTFRKTVRPDELPDNTPATTKNVYRLIYVVLVIYTLLSLLSGPAKKKLEIIENLSAERYTSTSRQGSGHSSLDFTISTDLGNKYFVSTNGGRPFQIQDTIFTFSNFLFRKIGIEAHGHYYSFDRIFALLILLSVTSSLGLAFTLFGDFRFKIVLYIASIINGGLLLLYWTA